LGKADTIDRLAVRWPNGEIQEWKKVSVNRKLSIVEGGSPVSN
jgi:hypothetical protein